MPEKCEKCKTCKCTTGKGLFRKDGVLPPSARKLLDKVKDETITSVKIVRTPIASMLKQAINWLSGGKFEDSIKQAGYDKVYHLALFINDKYTFDKQEVLKFVSGSPIKKDSEVYQVPSIPEGLTIGKFIENTKQKMGDKAFTSYDALNNNCQKLVAEALRSNQMGTDEAIQFTQQDAVALLKKTPAISKLIMKTATDLGAVADKIVQGEGSKPKKMNAWVAHYRMVCANNKGQSVKDLVQLAKETYKKE